MSGTQDTRIGWDLDSEMLAGLMSGISEGYYCAGWLIDLEFSLWAVVVGDDPNYFGFGGLSEREIKNLRELSRRIDGWIVWNDGREDNSDEWRRIVPMSEWQSMYAEYRKENA